MLEAVAHLGPGTTAKEIATFAGVPSATAYRMLNLLVAEGFLVRVPDLSGFALGRRTAELSHAASSSGPAPTLHERVEDMRTHTRFGLHVASFAGGRLRFVDKDPDHEIIGIAALPKNLHANALGRCCWRTTSGCCRAWTYAGSRSSRSVTSIFCLNS